MKKIIIVLIVMFVFVCSSYAQRAATETRESNAQPAQQVLSPVDETHTPSEPTQRVTIERVTQPSPPPQTQRVVVEENEVQPEVNRREQRSVNTQNPVLDSRPVPVQSPIMDARPVQTPPVREQVRPVQSQPIWESTPVRVPTDSNQPTPDSRQERSAPALPPRDSNSGRMGHEDSLFPETLIERIALNSVSRLTLILGGISLDGNQMDFFNRLNFNFQTHIMEKDFELRRLLSEFQIATNGYNFNRAGRIALDINNVRGEIAASTINYLEAVVSMLTAEQREQLVSQRGANWLVD
ncbi:MAG: hypothetical protein FWG98_01945 [Candidatus Cloacimonetes bacterium]|nr:hypothetical protein [Candidatus Cloacimonadota bacterium]